MAYPSLEAAALDLEKHGKLLRISSEVDPHLEMAEIHRRGYSAITNEMLLESRDCMEKIVQHFGTGRVAR